MNDSEPRKSAHEVVTSIRSRRGRPTGGTGAHKVPDWHDIAACNEPDIVPDLFYPEGDQVKTYTRLARQMCARCPVDKDACRRYGDAISPQWGIFGGLTVPERRRLRQAEQDVA